MGQNSMAVLLVGETARNWHQLLQWFESRGYKCRLASSYRDACSLISRTEFDVVLSQYQLPDRTAFPLLEWLEGSSASLYLSTSVESGSLWLPMLDRGKRCVGAPLLRGSNLAEAFDKLLCSEAAANTQQPVVTGDYEKMHEKLRQVLGKLGDSNS